MKKLVRSCPRSLGGQCIPLTFFVLSLMLSEKVRMASLKVEVIYSNNYEESNVIINCEVKCLRGRTVQLSCDLTTTLVFMTRNRKYIVRCVAFNAFSFLG